MNTGVSAIQYMGMLMSQPKIEIALVLELVELLNKSYFSCQNVVTIIEDIFQNEKSNRIFMAVEVQPSCLDSRLPHQKLQSKFSPSRQQRILPKKNINSAETSTLFVIQVRGKSSFLKDLRSNLDNWNKIEAKVLYLIQLWYDAFILE
jgi:hypothetical protein